ncbi:hypothetical protein GE061_007904 [Apolygus lucorum]|uniref:Uncharacterized protein n=1 Tax=Apolygus lucorum TaxID=248454 RepID=A0A6A4J403_APOLU|nr:hypothetical protein GE061_007904 [Apolygus lucorum]
MSTKKDRKTRPSSARSPKSKGPESLAAEGIYSNPYFMNSVVALVGSAVKVHTASGSVYEGILKTFSPQFDVVVELAHKVDPSNSMHICLESVVGKMVFKQQGIVKIAVVDQDLEYATRDTFQTDTAISKFNGQLGEKELEPWDSTIGGSDDFELDGGGTANGWDVNEMFRQNEEVFGVTSSFDHALAGYTTPLQKENKDFKEVEAKASKIANEIESSTYYKNRIELENGDEEEKFAAVVRPPHHEANGEGLSNKYVPPQKRKNSTQVNKTARTSSSSPPVSAPSGHHHHHSQVATVSSKGTGPVATAVPVVASHPQVTVQVQQQPQQQQQVPQHSVSANSSSVRERDQGRERVNGGNPMYESPKPQRVNSNVRHGRNFGSTEGSRSASNGSMSSPTSTISSASSSTNHSDQQQSQAPVERPPPPQQQPQPHHRNPPPGPSSYGAPHGGQVVQQMVVSSPNDHKVPHNQNTSYMVQTNPNMSGSPAPQQQDQHHRNINQGPYAHANPNQNQSNDYRGNQVHSYVHNCGPSNNNSVSPSASVTVEPQYIQGPRGHYITHTHPSSNPNDHRGQPHYGPITYSVPMMPQGATMVEMRAQPPPQDHDGHQQMMGPQPPVVQNQMHYQRKPPIVTSHTVVDHGPQSLGGQGAMTHKTNRRRKETNELKAFGQDFKLADPEEVAAALAKRSPHGAGGEDDQQQMTGRMHDGPSEMHNQQGMQRPSPAPKPEPPKVLKSKLNPNAKEFVYNPSKPFTPAMSTPSQSRPHTPQTPAGYAPMPPQQLGHPISMMMPAYVVTTTQPPYPQPPTQQTRYPKVHMGVASQPSQMQVAAATGQPLLAPAPLPQFTVPYPPQGYLPQPYQQMVRMVQHGDAMTHGPMIATINFPGPEQPQAAQIPFMAAPPPPPQAQQHPQHPPMHLHPQQNNASSPQSNGNNQMAYHRVNPRGW